MADTIVDGTQFNSQNIKYTAPKVNASGGKSVNILNKQTNTGLRLSTPLMLTWGASDFEGNGKFEFALQFPTEEYTNPDLEVFLKNMSAFEAKIKADALAYSKEWFGKLHKSADVVDALWTPMLKYSKNKVTGEYDLSKPPSLRVKIPIWEGVWRAEVYDEEGQKMFPDASNPLITPVDFIQKGIHVACLLQCGGLWFANGKFGMTWKLVQAVAQKPRANLTGQCFLKLKTSDKEKLKQPVNQVVANQEEDDEDILQPALTSSSAVSSTIVEDSDDEESAPVVAPVAVAAVEVAPAKKKIIKKKAVAQEEA